MARCGAALAIGRFLRTAATYGRDDRERARPPTRPDFMLC